MKKLLFILPVLCLFITCKKEVETPVDRKIGGAIYLQFKDQQGRNLLEPTTPKMLRLQNMETYLLRRNGERELSRYATFTVRDSEKIGKYMYYTFTGGDLIDDKTTAFIKYQDFSEDKIVIQYRKPVGYNTVMVKLWINDVLVRDDPNNSTYEIIEVIK